MKKKILLLVVVLVAAVLLVSGCSTDSLKERVPGVKANVNMLLADNNQGDLEYEVGEIKGEEYFEDDSSGFDSFGSDIISDVEQEITDISAESNFDLPEEISGETADADITSEFEDRVEVDLTAGLDSESDVSSLLEKMEFEDARLEVIIKDSPEAENESTKISLLSLEITKVSNNETFGNPLEDNPGIVDISGSKLGLEDILNIDFDARIELNQDEEIPSDPTVEVNLNSSDGGTVTIASIDVELNENILDTLGESYDNSINVSLVEDYEKEEFIDALTVSDSNLFVNFEITEGINLDLSSVFVKPVDSNNDDVTSDSEEYKFSLAEEPLTINNNSAELDLDKIVSMLQDPATSDVLIEGDIGLTSDGILTITKESELGVKNAVLESAELTIDNYQFEPEAAEEGLTASEVDDIKKALESIELTVDGLTNPLPAAVDLKLYVKDGADSKEELYAAENLLKTFNLKAETENTGETVILEKDQFDKFTGSNLFIGVELYSDTTFIPEEYSEKIIEAAQITTKFNVDISVDDIDE